MQAAEVSLLPSDHPFAFVALASSAEDYFGMQFSTYYADNMKTSTILRRLNDTVDILQRMAMATRHSSPCYEIWCFIAPPPKLEEAVQKLTTDVKVRVVMPDQLEERMALVYSTIPDEEWDENELSFVNAIKVMKWVAPHHHLTADQTRL